MKKLSAISLLMTSLLLAACNKEPTGSKWYEIGDFYDTVTYAEKVPARTIKNKLGVDAIPSYLPTEQECVYYIGDEYCVVAYEGDILANLEEFVGDGFDFYQTYASGAPLVIDTARTSGVFTEVFTVLNEDGTEVVATEFDLYACGELYGTTLTTAEAWTTAEINNMTTFCGYELPFMKFGSEAEWTVQEEEDETYFFFADYYLYDLVDEYIAILEAQSYQYDEDTGCYAHPSGTFELDVYWCEYGNNIDVWLTEAE